MIFLTLSTCSSTARLLVPPTTSLRSTLVSKLKTSLTSSENFGDSVCSCSSVSSASDTLFCSASRTAEPEMWCVSRKGVCVHVSSRSASHSVSHCEEDPHPFANKVFCEVRREHVVGERALHVLWVDLQSGHVEQVRTEASILERRENLQSSSL